MPKPVERLGYELNDLAFETRQGQGIFLFPERPEQRWDTAYYLMGNGALSRVKTTGALSWPFMPLIDVTKNEWTCTSSPALYLL